MWPGRCTRPKDGPRRLKPPRTRADDLSVTRHAERASTTRDGDQGFTLIEVLVAMVLMGILSSIGAYGWQSVQKTQEGRGTQRELLSAMRNAQTRAVAENITYCLDFGTSPSRTATVYRVPGVASGALPVSFTCGSASPPFGTVKAQGDARFGTPAFEHRNGSTTGYALFYPRGAASPGTVQVTGTGIPVYTLTLDGLTGRVASTGL